MVILHRSSQGHPRRRIQKILKRGCALLEMQKEWAQDKNLFRTNNGKRNKARTHTETPVWQSIGNQNVKYSRSGARTEYGSRENCRSAPTDQEGTNGSQPEKGLGGRDLGKRRGIQHRNAIFSLKSPEPEKSDLQITSGLQTMAISRNRKYPSAGSDLDQEESHFEDGRPLKKIATSCYNI